jgi:hypothetical protein
VPVVARQSPALVDVAVVVVVVVVAAEALAEADALGPAPPAPQGQVRQAAVEPVAAHAAVEARVLVLRPPIRMIRMRR